MPGPTVRAARDALHGREVLLQRLLPRHAREPRVRAAHAAGAGRARSGGVAGDRSAVSTITPATTHEALGVRTLPHDMHPRENLHVQSAIVAGASAFVGTYGGFSYLAPFLGVPSTAYYSDPHGLLAAAPADGAVGARVDRPRRVARRAADRTGRTLR